MQCREGQKEALQTARRRCRSLALAASVLLAAAGCGDGPPPSTPVGRPAAQAPAPAARDPLPSWNDTDAKRAILDFVVRVTTESGAEFVPPEERVAVFDNDGTLWTEQPFYTQLAFAFDRVRVLAPENPAWRDEQPFKGVLEGDLAAALAGGEQGIGELLAATHAGSTTEEFAAIVTEWIGAARHPRFDKPYTEMVYQPMLEVLALLREHGFATFVVSGGGVEFMRPWTERVYGIGPERVVGSRAKVEYRLRDREPVLLRLAEADLVNDGDGKPVGIHQQIGRRPIAAFGNSDGDFEMLEWTTAAPGPRLGVLVHHTDGAREWAYDRDSPIGRLARGLDEAAERGWLVVDMQRDWAVIYPFER